METTCGRCGRPLSPTEETYIPRYIHIPLAVVMAFGHGGLWAMQGLSRPFCPRCRSLLIAIAIAVIAAAVAAVSCGVRLWLYAAHSWRNI